MTQRVDKLFIRRLERPAHSRGHEPIRFWSGMARSRISHLNKTTRGGSFAIRPAVVIPIGNVKTHAIGRDRDADGPKFIDTAFDLGLGGNSLEDDVAFLDAVAGALTLHREANELALAPFEHEKIAAVA